MSELIPVLETLLADVEAGRPVALCAVVKTTGSTPQAPGAAMLVRADMSTLGTLGGGCVEAEVRKTAFQMLQQNQSGLRDYLLDHDFGWDDGLICGGHMLIAVMPIVPGTDAPPVQGGGRNRTPTALNGVREPDHSPSTSGRLLDSFKHALDRAKQRQPAQLPIVVEHEGKRLEYRLHLEVSPTLLIAGAGHVGQAVARLAADLDFHVVVVDDRADFASRQRFGEHVELIVDDIARALRDYPIDAGCYVVIVTRGHQHDHEALKGLIRRPAAYIGMIGSKRKSRMILCDLAEAGVPQELLNRVHTPIGVPISAVTVNEIAVSIVAELIQVRRQTTPKLVEGPFGRKRG